MMRTGGAEWAETHSYGRKLSFSFLKSSFPFKALLFMTYSKHSKEPGKVYAVYQAEVFGQVGASLQFHSHAELNILSFDRSNK